MSCQLNALRGRRQFSVGRRWQFVVGDGYVLRATLVPRRPQLYFGSRSLSVLVDSYVLVGGSSEC